MPVDLASRLHSYRAVLDDARSTGVGRRTRSASVACRMLHSLRPPRPCSQEGSALRS